MRITIKIFGLLLLTILIQEIINRSFEENFIIGIAPTLIFGTVWNLYNGQQIYAKLKDRRNFNITKFKGLSIWAIVWMIIYMILLNIFLWPPQETGNQSFAQMIFMPASALSAIFPVYALYYNIDFVTRGLTNYYNDRGLRFRTIFSLLFFPIGLFWIQSKVLAIR